MESINKTHEAIIQDIIAKDNKIFEVTLKISDNFTFKAGQYIWVELPELQYVDPKGNRRAFSILNDDKSDQIIKYIFRFTKSGYKKTMVKMKKGQKVKVIGPLGSSFCFPEHGENMIFFAGGVGISPFLSLIEYAASHTLSNKIKLIYKTNKKETDIFYKYVSSMKDTYPIHEGLVIEDFKQIPDMYFDHKDTLVYVSGPQTFVNETYKFLLSKKINLNNIRFENFYPQTEAVYEIQKIFDQYIENEKEAQQIGDVLFSAIQNSSNHTIVTDVNGVILFANKAAQEITGFSFEEMSGNTPRLWGGQMSKEFYKKLWESKLNGVSTKVELINRRKDGTLYNVLANITTIRNTRGEVIGFIGNEEDITTIRKKEAELLDRTREAELLNKVAVDRELKMIELKEENKKLKQKLNENI